MHKISVSQDVVHIEVSKKLTRADYDELIPSWKEMIAQEGALRMVFIMKDFEGWEPGAAWQDLQFDLEYASKIDRVAMVGDKRWEKWLTKLASFFVKADVKYFDATELSAAEQWIRAG